MHRSYRSIWKGLISLIFAFLWAASNVTPSFADIAPPPPPEGFTILPGSENTQVRMVYENVFMNIDLAGVAKVDANFVMRNLGEKEESMEVRFPLYSSAEYQKDNLKCGTSSGWELMGSPIADLAVWVWDKPQFVNTINDTMSFFQPKTDKHAIMPCWGVFEVIFPPGIDVPIEVKYTSPTYSYILTTGAGWNGTIGQADITFRLPYEAVLGQSLDQCFPKTCVLNGRDIQWKFNDFEPKENVSINLIKPDVWWRIITEINNLKLNSSDGQAWKRLAIAYRDSLRLSIKGTIVNDPKNIKHYQLSVETFQKAISLIPNDSDLHLRYADLLSIDWFSIPVRRVDDYQVDPFKECVRQLKQSLDLDPQNKNALGLLRQLADFTFNEQPVIRMNGLQPDYLILTPTIPTPTSIYWQTPFSARGTSEVPTQPPATRTPAAAITPSLSSQPSPTPAFPLTTLTTPTPIPAPGEKEAGSAWLWAFIPLAAILAIAFMRKRGER